jgi:4-amino-4-deoxy-L-arabinose transferase-like glycosyltransferase
MYALYDRSPALFAEWFFTNNLDRFFGPSRIGPHNPPGFYASVLSWYAFPALPLAALAVWTAWRSPESRMASPDLAMPLLLTAVMLSVLGFANNSRELYLMPVVLPLSLLAAKGISVLPAIGTAALSQAARWGLAALAIGLWLGWLVLVSGLPASLHAMLLAYQPAFVAKVHWVHLGTALSATALAVWVLLRRAAHASFALAQWTVAAALCWCLVGTLWTPYLNAGKSYRTMITSLVQELPETVCVASLHLGEPQRALLMYFSGIKTSRLEVEPTASCSTLLVQGWRDNGAPAPSPDWKLVWEGARPGDSRELYRLYRRDVAPAQIARFP